MSTTLEQLEERVAYLERELKRAHVLSDHQEAQTDRQLATISRQISELVQQMKAGFDEVAKNFAGVNKRLDWQDGQFADLRADMTDLSNRVAGIVQREGKREGEA